MFDLNPNSLVLKVEQHSTSPAVADADHAKLYPISIFERAATKDENIRDAESRGKALRFIFCQTKTGKLGSTALRRE